MIKATKTSTLNIMKGAVTTMLIVSVVEVVEIWGLLFVLNVMYGASKGGTDLYDISIELYPFL